MKRLGVILLFIIENVPNIGFWIGVFYIFRSWFLSQLIITRFAIILLPTVLLWISVRRGLSTTKTQLLKINAESALEEKNKKFDIDRTKKLIENIPSKKDLIYIYNYGNNYARSWASDGLLDYINFYIDVTKWNNVVSKKAQIFISSSLRSEVLTTYIPGDGFSVEEMDKILSNKEVPLIYSYSHWKDAVEKILENSISDIEKSDNTKVQFSPCIDYLAITVRLEKDNRKWTRRYKLMNNKIYKDEFVIFTYDK